MTYAPYLVYTHDDDFVLEKGDISGGSGGEVFIIETEQTQSGIALKKTWKEIKDAYNLGKICILELTGTFETSPYTCYTSIISTFEVTLNNNSLVYGVSFIEFTNGEYTTATINSENGYPHTEE